MQKTYEHKHTSHILHTFSITNNTMLGFINQKWQHL